jgi:hypothetical protein
VLAGNGHSLPAVQIDHGTPEDQIGFLHLPELPLSVQEKLVVIGQQNKNPAVDKVCPTFRASAAQ